MRTRPGARLIVLDDRDRVLMFKCEDPVTLDPAQPTLTVYWCTPGGALEANETFEQAARRELWEETGMRGLEISPCLWTRDKVFRIDGEEIHGHERYFLVRASSSEVSLVNLSPHEWRCYRGHRWWSLADMRRSGDTFLPPGLADLLVPVFEGHVPLLPLDIGGTSGSKQEGSGHAQIEV